ncbi:MAG: hypothetical protein Tsb0010_10530 [Parvularculaceae bacterium]
MPTIAIPYAVYLATAANAALLGAALAYRSHRARNATIAYAAGFLLTASAAILLISLDHAAALPSARGWNYLEGALGLAAGAWFALFVCGVVDRPARPLHLFGAALLAGAAAAFLTADGVAFLNLSVFGQIGFSTVAAFVYWRSGRDARRRGRAHIRRRRLALALLLIIGLLHASQLFRMAAPGVTMARDVVPLFSTVIFAALSVAIFAGLRGLSEIAPQPRPPELTALAARLDAAMAQQELYKLPELKLADAAAALGVAAAQLSHAVNAEFGLTFSEYLASKRLEEAARLLHDPGEARTSVEAIGLMAGFGSRSALYAAFKARHGISPAEFRRKFSVNMS